MDNPPEVENFVPGEVITDPAKPLPEPVVILMITDDGQNALLAPLISKPPISEVGNRRPTAPYWTSIGNLTGWEPVYFDGPRLVTAYERGTKKQLWETYAPDIAAAINLMREINFDENRTMDLAVAAQHTDELETLDDYGFFGPDNARNTANEMRVEYYSDIEGSATSSDGRVFVLRARGADGTVTNVGFPHAEASVIVEHIAIQAEHAKDNEGRPIHSAFKTKSFALGTDPGGNAIQGMQVSGAGTINFQLSGNMAEELMDLLAQYVAQKSRGSQTH